MRIVAARSFVPRVICAAAAISRLHCNSGFAAGASFGSYYSHGTRFLTLKTRSKNCEKSVIRRTMASSGESEEVKKAQEAAAAHHASSDQDGAGPATVFDKILSGEWSSQKVFEDERCLAFRDVNPQSPTHILLIPKERDGLTQLSKARPDQTELLGHLLYVAQQVGTKECPDGFRIVINDGKDGAQSVYHLHLHIMGGRQMQWPPG